MVRYKEIPGNESTVRYDGCDLCINGYFFNGNECVAVPGCKNNIYLNEISGRDAAKMHFIENLPYDENILNIYEYEGETGSVLE